MIATYLIDKSAYSRLHRDEVHEAVQPLMVNDQLAVCPMITLELLYSARSSTDYDRVLSTLDALPNMPMNSATWTLAHDLQYRLSRRGQHRRAIPDLLISATALQHELVVLHYDNDFELIAAVSELQHSWVVPRGTVN